LVKSIVTGGWAIWPTRISRTIDPETHATIHPVVVFDVGGQIMHKAAGTLMSYIITGTNSAGVLSLKRDSAVAAVKKAVELMGDGTRDVHITDPDEAPAPSTNSITGETGCRVAARPVMGAGMRDSDFCA
jgi:hypothetical protein